MNTFYACLLALLIYQLHVTAGRKLIISNRFEQAGVELYHQGLSFPSSDSLETKATYYQVLFFLIQAFSSTEQ